MKIVNDDLTHSYCERSRCRWCNKRVMTCGAHVFAKGQAGGSQIDIPCNIVKLGLDAIRDCICHAAHHNGDHPTFDELLAISAEDNKCRPEDIVSLIYLIRRLPRIEEVSEEDFRWVVAQELPITKTRKLALRELATFRHLLRKA